MKTTEIKGNNLVLVHSEIEEIDKYLTPYNELPKEQQKTFGQIVEIANQMGCSTLTVPYRGQTYPPTSRFFDQKPIGRPFPILLYIGGEKPEDTKKVVNVFRGLYDSDIIFINETSSLTDAMYWNKKSELLSTHDLLKEDCSLLQHILEKGRTFENERLAMSYTLKDVVYSKTLSNDATDYLLVFCGDPLKNYLEVYKPGEKGVKTLEGILN